MEFRGHWAALAALTVVHWLKALELTAYTGVLIHGKHGFGTLIPVRLSQLR